MEAVELTLDQEEYEIDVIQSSDDEFSFSLSLDSDEISFEIDLVIIAATPAEVPVFSVVKCSAIHENQKLLTTSLGSKIPDIDVMETEGNDVTISLGTYPGGNDIIEDYAIIGGQPNYLLLNYTSHINLTSVDLYISSADWNGANLNVYITLKKLE